MTVIAARKTGTTVYHLILDSEERRYYVYSCDGESPSYIGMSSDEFWGWNKFTSNAISNEHRNEWYPSDVGEQCFKGGHHEHQSFAEQVPRPVPIPPYESEILKSLIR